MTNLKLEKKSWQRLYRVGMAVLIGLLSGCMNSYPVTEKEMDLFWQGNGDVMVRSTAHPLEIDGRTIPTQGIMRFEPDTEAAEASIDRAIESLKAGTDRLDFSVSPAHSEMLADILADTRVALENLHRISRASTPADRRLWNRNLAEALVHIETVIRLVFAETSGTEGEAAGAAPGKAAGPLLQMITTYLDEDTHGELLGELTGEQRQELRNVLSQILLRGGFEVSGKKLPSDTLADTVLLMKKTRDLNELKELLAENLLQAHQAAAPLEEATQLAKAFRGLTRWAPRLLEGLEVLMRQWPKVKSVEYEIRTLEEQPIFTAVVHVADREEVELARFSSAQPRLSFRGSTRVTFLLRQPSTEETVVAFEPLSEDGGVQVRFEGIVYGLTRLLAFPLDDGVLDEIRVYIYDPAQGDELRHVTLLMRNPSDRKDPRRLMVFQDTRRKEWQREAFGLEKRLVWESQDFHYLKPHRRYSFSRTKEYE